MAKTIKRGKNVVWIDGAGLEVPEKYIKPEDKARDKLVSSLLVRARKLSRLIAREKEIMSTQIARHLTAIAAEKGTTWEGGTTLWNFSMDECVTVKVAKRWVFDEKLDLAKRKIDECIHAWAPGSNDKLVQLIMGAFEVDSKGKVDPFKIIGLRQYNFDDPPWIEAMELIAEAQKVQRTKTYYYFMEAGEDGALKRVLLDFAVL